MPTHGEARVLLGRRAMLKLAITVTMTAVAAAVATQETPPPGPDTTPGTPGSRKGSNKMGRGRRVPLDRYSLTPTLYDGTVLPALSSLEAIWADPRYLKMSSCAVKYTGRGTYRLTDAESAAVDVAVAAGATGSRTDICLSIITACSRVDQRTVYAGLTQIGRPIVDGALVLAPVAPQAAVMQRWIAEGMPSSGKPTA